MDRTLTPLKKPCLSYAVSRSCFTKEKGQAEVAVNSDDIKEQRLVAARSRRNAVDYGI